MNAAVAAPRLVACVLLAVSITLLAAAPERPMSAAEFHVGWGTAVVQDPVGSAEPRCKCPGIAHDGIDDADGTLYDDGIFIQQEPGSSLIASARFRVGDAACECGTQPGHGRCIATARVTVPTPRGTRICLDHAGGARWFCAPDNDCAPRHQCCVLSRSGVGNDEPRAAIELVDSTLCGSFGTAVFPVSRELIGPDCSVPPDFRIADVRFHWRCGACAPEAASDSGG